MRRPVRSLYLAYTKYINNWDLVDCPAEHIVGAHLVERDRSKLTARWAIAIGRRRKLF